MKERLPSEKLIIIVKGEFKICKTVPMYKRTLKIKKMDGLFSSVKESVEIPEKVLKKTN